MGQKYLTERNEVWNIKLKNLLAILCFSVMCTAATLFSFKLVYNMLLVQDEQPEATVQALSRQGSTGSEVTQIQTKLKNWGYYNGTVDGIYGSRTTEAVRKFQRTNGLTVDGICGPQTLSAMGIAVSTTGGATQNDINLLAQLISAEARGEPYNGQVAVGGVVLNRVKHPSFPNSIAGVIYQPGAFSCLTDGQFYEPVAASARNAARDALNGVDPSNGAIYYYAPAKATNKWIRSRPIIKTIGTHVFCK